MRSVLVLLFVLIVETPLWAQFKANDNSMSFGNGIFECGIVQTVPRDSDNDPTYKINLSVGFNTDELKKLSDMNVVHVSVDGKTYPRADQYTNDALWQIPGKLEIFWKGTWKKNPSVKMTGRFWNEVSNRRWFYTETQSRGGSVRMQMTSICHPIGLE